MKDFKKYILDIKTYNLTKYIPQVVDYLKEIIKDKSSSIYFRNFSFQLLLHFQT